MASPLSSVAVSQGFNFFQDLPSLSGIIEKITEAIKEIFRSFKKDFHREVKGKQQQNSLTSFKKSQQVVSSPSFSCHRPTASIAVLQRRIALTRIIVKHAANNSTQGVVPLPETVNSLKSLEQKRLQSLEGDLEIPYTGRVIQVSAVQTSRARRIDVDVDLVDINQYLDEEKYKQAQKEAEREKKQEELRLRREIMIEAHLQYEAENQQRNDTPQWRETLDKLARAVGFNLSNLSLSATRTAILATSNAVTISSEHSSVVFFKKSLLFNTFL
jgi:hypothetical protein